MRTILILTMLALALPAYAKPVTLVCKGEVNFVRGALPVDKMQGQQWTITIDTATGRLAFYPPSGGTATLGIFGGGKGDNRWISLQTSIDRDKGTPFEDDLPSDGHG
jgi:hypothetical protein